MTRYADKDAAPPQVWRCSCCGQKWPRHDPDCMLRHVGPHKELEEVPVVEIGQGTSKRVWPE